MTRILRTLITVSIFWVFFWGQLVNGMVGTVEGCDETNVLDYTRDRERVEKLIRETGAGCQLKMANLSGMDLSGAFLQKADLRGAYLWKTNFYKSRLTGANMSWADLSEANMAEADLMGVDLTGAILWDTNFWDARLFGADLTWADLVGANFREADLRSANLSEAQRLPKANLLWAVYNRETRFPAEVNPVELDAIFLQE